MTAARGRELVAQGERREVAGTVGAGGEQGRRGGGARGRAGATREDAVELGTEGIEREARGGVRAGKKESHGREEEREKKRGEEKE